MKKVAVFVSLVLVTCSIAAHEFWIQPDRFLYEAGETIYLRFWIGENFEGENWKGNVHNVEMIKIRQDDLEDQLTDAIGEASGDSLDVSLYEEGTAMIIMQTRDQNIKLSATEFNEYLREDGLQNAIEYRELHHETDSSANENYQRNVKTIIQVGDELNNCMSRPTGLPLDIIPEKNPYDPSLKDSIIFLVKFKEVPLKGQLMKAWHHENSNTEVIESRTDSSGRFSVPLVKTGKWMVSTVQMVRIKENVTAWQSYWGSCTWGYY